MKSRTVAAAAAIAALAAVPASAEAKSVKRLVNEHTAAVKACDAADIVDDYAPNATVFFPDGVVVHGRKELRPVFEDFVKPRSEGGLCGLASTAVERSTHGRTTFVKFRTIAPFLAQPYFATDGYVFRGDLIVSEVSTFDASKLKFTP